MAQVEKAATSVLGVMDPPEAPKAPKAKATKPTERFYAVQADVQVPRESGGGNYFLRKGKVISTRGYDVERLRKLGVSLEEVPQSVTV